MAERLKVRGFDDPEVRAVFDAYPVQIKACLAGLRQLIFDTANSLDCAGEVYETLKWGQPAYLTRNPKTGTTIRIDAIKSDPEKYAIFFHCQTDLVNTFRQRYPDIFEYSGKRAIIFRLGDTIPVRQLGHCIAMALTYQIRDDSVVK